MNVIEIFLNLFCLIRFWIILLWILFQTSLLEDHMRDLRRVIRPGSKRLNWNSLGINDFVLKCRNVSIYYMYKYLYFYEIDNIGGWIFSKNIFNLSNFDHDSSISVDFLRPLENLNL